jgi:hypothetical protein
VKSKQTGQHRPAVLDRLVDVMRHFHCGDLRDLGYLLGLPSKALTSLFRNPTGKLPAEVVRAMEAAGVQPVYLKNGTGSMLSEVIDSVRLEVMKRHAAILLRLICSARSFLSESVDKTPTLIYAADGLREPVAIEEELINLLIEALNDTNSRERLIKFIRADIANRKQTMK